MRLYSPVAFPFGIVIFMLLLIALTVIMSLSTSSHVVETRLSGNQSHVSLKERIPAFTIIGAQKCGTTSMYEYICQHPLVLPYEQREVHYFERSYNLSLPDSDTMQHWRQYRDNFMIDKLHKNHSLITGESSPAYMMHTHTVIPRMLRICPWAKLIVMLRNPTDRAYSQYQMIMETTGSVEELEYRRQFGYLNQTFVAIIREEIKSLQEKGISPNMSDSLWNEQVLQHVPIAHGSHSIVARGLYVLQLRVWLSHWPMDQIRIHTMKELQGPKEKVQRTMNTIFDYLHLPPHEISDVEPKNSRKYEPVSAESRAILDEFYAPYNAALFKLLGKELTW